MKSWLFVFVSFSLVPITGVRAADIPTVGRPSMATNVPSISLTGEAEEQVRPDHAVLTLEAVDEKPTATDAAVENAGLTRALTATLQTYGLSAADIEAGSLDLSPQYRERTDPKSGEVIERVFTGYRASATYRVKVPKVEDAPRIAREMVENGSSSYRSVTFEMLDRDNRLDVLRAKALQNALLRAQRYAASASLKLGDIIEIRPEFQEASAGRDPNAADAPLGQVAVSIPARANDIKLHAAVRVSWELKPQTAECKAGSPRK